MSYIVEMNPPFGIGPGEPNSELWLPAVATGQEANDAVFATLDGAKAYYGLLRWMLCVGTYYDPNSQFRVRDSETDTIVIP